MALRFGLDIGGTKCSVVCARAWPHGKKPCILSKRMFRTKEYPEPAQAMEMFVRLIDEMCTEFGESADGIGISCGGPLDSKRGMILSPPNLPGWDNISIVDFFQNKFAVPCYLQNDANACAIAEWKFGAGIGCRHMLFLTFGTGLGAGMILDGRLYSGTNDLAGEAGHIRIAPDGPEGYGKAGSFEGYCSGAGIAHLAQQMYASCISSGGTTLLSPDDFSAARVAQLATQGDALCRSIYQTCGRKLGEGLAMLVDLLNPERIVIGSIFARAEWLLRGEMEQSLRREALPGALDVCAVVPAALGDQLGDFAALGVLENGLEADGWKT